MLPQKLPIVHQVFRIGIKYGSVAEWLRALSLGLKGPEFDPLWDLKMVMKIAIPWAPL